MCGIVQWIALVGIIAFGVLFVIEMLKWRQPGNVMSRRHKALRVGLVALLEAVLVMVFLAPMVSNPKNMLGELIYWSVCLMLGLAVVVLALFDLREATKELPALSRQVYHDVFDDGRRDSK